MLHTNHLVYQMIQKYEHLIYQMINMGQNFNLKDENHQINDEKIFFLNRLSFLCFGVLCTEYSFSTDTPNIIVFVLLVVHPPIFETFDLQPWPSVPLARRGHAKRRCRRHPLYLPVVYFPYKRGYLFRVYVGVGAVLKIHRRQYGGGGSKHDSHAHILENQ